MNRLICVFLLAVMLPLIALSQKEDNMKTALIIVDVQEFYFVEGSSQLTNPEQASEKAAQILNRFRKDNDLVVHVKHASETDSAIHKNVAPLGGEKVITKHYVNSYRETDLLEYLNQHKIDQVVVCGMMTHMCLEAAARASADFGFQVIVIEDACATRDITYENRTVKAADVHAATLGTIDRYYGKVMTAEDFLKQETYSSSK